jgi:SPX domain protein involved in polyphosphate accumulation
VSFRKEKKFRVTVNDFYNFQDQLHRLGMETLFEPRYINSVYFDTINLNMFHDSEEGVLPRKKVRIRWYGDSKVFTLENKTSSLEGRFKVTTKLENNIIENKILTRNRMDAQYGSLHPVLKISYERSYFMFNKMRITLDKNICYQNLKFADRRKYYDPERVIEIKIPFDCSDDFVEKFIPFPTSRFSKYSRGLLLVLGGLNEV